MSDKHNLEKMVKNLIAGEKEAAQQYLSTVLASKSQKIVNESEKEEVDEKNKETSPKSSVNIHSELKTHHDAAEDKEAFLGHVAKACGMETVTKADLSKCAKHLETNEKSYKSLMNKFKKKSEVKEKQPNEKTVEKTEKPEKE